MRKKLSALALACFLIFVAPLTASAHKGRTDSSGGHTDYSTGEYHYHHGYEAHQHYDMDGDGVADCPYDFDDQTNHNSGSSNSSQKSTTTETTKPALKSNSTRTANSATSTNKNDEGIINMIGWILSAILSLVLIASRNSYKETIHSLEGKTSTLKEALSETLCAISSSNLGTAKERFLLRYAHFGSYNVQIPPDVEFTDDGIPIKGTVTDIKPFGDFTVYKTYGSVCYHLKCGCSGAYTAVHCLDVGRQLRPCQQCSRSANLFSESDLDWWDKFNRICYKADLFSKNFQIKV